MSQRCFDLSHRIRAKRSLDHMPSAVLQIMKWFDSTQASCLFKAARVRVFSSLCVCFRTVKSQMGVCKPNQSRWHVVDGVSSSHCSAPWHFHLRISGGEVEGGMGFYFPFPISSCPFNVMKANRMPAFGVGSTAWPVCQ